MMSLFRGYEHKSGTHGVPEREQGALKWNIKKTARTLSTKITLDIWEQHLAGTRPLGVIPIMADNTCVFGSIDYDEYDVDLIELMKKVESAKFPLVPVRSKSGGLHLFLFLKEPEPAADVQSVLKDAAAALGVAECEIFPKQTAIAAERGDAGSWIIVPYYANDYGGKLQLQHGLKPKGTDMTIEEFLKSAEKTKTTVDTFAGLLEKRITSHKPKDGKKRTRGKSPCDFSDGPPCLQHLTGNGSSPSEGRKRLIFMIAVYMKRADPEGWKERVVSANERFSPPLPAAEINGVITSVSKKDYEYTCKESPMREHCNASLCRTRKLGVGLGADFPQLELRKYETDPPIWFVTIDTIVVELETDDLLNYHKFTRACAMKTSRIFNFMQHAAWISLVKEAMERMDAPIKAPEDAGERGRFRELLEEFLTNRSRGERREDLLYDKPWECVEEGRHYFTLKSLQSHLVDRGMRDVKRNQITRLIEKFMEGGQHTFNFKNTQSRSTWWVPSRGIHGDVDVEVKDPGGDEV